MTRGHPVLQIYGQVHALSSRGLHVRESARSWKLIVPMPPELLEPVRAVCERVALADAARLLGLLERYMRRDAELPERALPQLCRPSQLRLGERVTVRQASSGTGTRC
jgi:hypothetical protein